jgi:hypothetical protein
VTRPSKPCEAKESAVMRKREPGPASLHNLWMVNLPEKAKPAPVVEQQVCAATGSTGVRGDGRLRQISRGT